MAKPDIVRPSGTAPNGKPFESVWDFPRPPATERVEWRIRVLHRGATVVDAPSAVRVLETSQPPAYYVDPQFVDANYLQTSDRTSFCEWKGVAEYAHIVIGGHTTTDTAWKYPTPNPGFADIAGFWAFYAQVLDGCHVDDEKVNPNPGVFYGGWLTENVTGPVKGAPGTLH